MQLFTGKRASRTSQVLDPRGNIIREHPALRAIYIIQFPLCRLYPNPASETVTVECDGGNISKIEVFDVAGRLLRRYEGVASQTFSMEVGGMKAGYYFVKTTVGSAVQVLTLVRR